MTVASNGVTGSRPYWVRIFVTEGDPDRVRIVEKSDWTGNGLVFPRSLLPRVRGRPDLGRAGFYLLTGPGEHSQLPRVYVGEGDSVLQRIEQHARSKEFWTHAVVFTSKDQNLNKAHVQYLEARVVELAHDARRCELDNGNVPQRPQLSEPDAAYAESFLADLMRCLPVLGLSILEKVSEAGDRRTELILKAKGIKAHGYEASQKFIVVKNSHAVASEVPSIHPYLSDLRRTLVDQKLFIVSDDGFILTQDYVFASPSTAAGVLLGRSANGRIEWKSRDGRTLKDFQESEAPYP